MNGKKENFDELFPMKKITDKLIKIKSIKYSQYFFEFFTNRTIFIALRGNVKELIISKQDEIFFLKEEKEKSVKIVKKDLPGGASNVLLDLGPEILFFIGEDGERDIDQDLTINFMKNFTLEKLLESEKRYSLLYLYAEFEYYFFKCFKYLLNKRPDIIDKVKLNDKEIKDADGDIEQMRDKRIDKKIRSIISNIQNIFYYTKSKFGIEISVKESTLDHLKLFKEVRNLYAHRNGIIDRLFLKKINPELNKDKKYKNGEIFALTEEFIKEVQMVIGNILRKFDMRLTKKYPEIIYE